MRFSLIVPIAADKQEFTQEIPYLFVKGSSGIMPCVRAITGMDLTIFDEIFFVILKKHDNLYLLKKLFDEQFALLSIEKKAKLIILDVPTSNQPETIVRTIEIAKLKGAIMIKDADSYFHAEITPQFSVATFPLDALKRVNPQDKSYVAVDDIYYITNIIEKKIISRFFCAGGYVFEDADEFCSYYEKMKKHNGIYLSHIIYAMLLDNKNFRPIPVKEYQDWGTREDYLISFK